ncbi:hypothetical protein [Actinomadura roseirufa]|uniref:hypothetical protein n=1 Tax=Actinomadura roseirufa TaxID=2094049 RepID=UPI001040F9EE|nr:hypothetical protein [Actinomadura roseirufa]
MRRVRVARAARAVAGAAVLPALLGAVAGCGVRPTGIISAGDKPIAEGNAAPLTVYLLRGRRLTPVVRPGLPGHPLLAVTQLGVPLTSAERRQGLHTEVPVDGRLQVRSEGRPGAITIYVRDMPPASRRPWTRAARAQVACTAEAVPGVRVVFLADDPDRDRYILRLKCDMYPDVIG